MYIIAIIDYERKYLKYREDSDKVKGYFKRIKK